MTAYKINIENTGLSYHDQARKVAGILKEKGYDVEFTRDFGHDNEVNPFEAGKGLIDWEYAMFEASKT